jgi:uncharacterized protein (DUF2126 family)
MKVVRSEGQTVSMPHRNASGNTRHLHPTVSLHLYLVFNIIDCRKARSIGRYIYHVRPSDDHSYIARPVNAAEAEERRLERFQRADPPSAPITMPGEETNAVHSITLDLLMPRPAHKIQIKSQN